MAVTQQRLHKIEFTELKSLINLPINFEPFNVTGIFGINGCGKSTIIHSLLCLFKPTDTLPSRENFKFSQYFTHTSHTKYVGSKFKIKHSFRQDINTSNNIERVYNKADRWKPRYENRPERDVFFIGIKTCVPEIEIEKSESLIRLTTINLSDAISIIIKQKAEIVLNRQYSEYNSHTYTAKNRKFIGVKHNNIPYSSLGMGAGEQRTFKILDIVFRAPKYSLIIIDEIDLTLHTDALNRLITVITERADEKNLQIIFTSHREELLKRSDVNIRHIQQINGTSICFDQTTPDCLSRLTGQPIRTLEIFVEDDLSEATVQKVIEELNIRRHCSIKRFGAIDNSFSLATGLFIKGENLANILILLDGDKYITPVEKMTQMEKYFSGTEVLAVSNRTNALSCIRQYTITTNETPEQFINNALRQINDNSEVVNAALQINAVANKHDFVNQIIRFLGYQDQTIGLNKVVDKLAESNNWINYTEEVRNWLIDKIHNLNLT
jgi:AAA15 family ATPase/GTPase